MKTLSKTLQQTDYKDFDEHQHVLNIRNSLRSYTRYEHQHRKWEYGIALKALRDNNTQTVLDVGGSGSVFAPAAVYLYMYVTQIDPASMEQHVDNQSREIDKPLPYIKQDFLEWKSNTKYDAVISLSVLEHIPVEREKEFFIKMMQYVKVGGLVILTVDFHPSGQIQNAGHFRTYNIESLNKIIKLAKETGFEYFGGKPDYSNFDVNVNTYTFASLVMRRT